MGLMYAWATPKYLLDYMTLEEVFFYYEKGADFEELKAELLVSKIAEALEGKKNKKKDPEKPDKEKFYQYYGDYIKRPDKGGE